MPDWKAKLKALEPCPEAYRWACQFKTLREAWRMCEWSDWMYWLWEVCGDPKQHLGGILDEVLLWGEDDDSYWNLRLIEGAQLFETYVILDFMPDPPRLPEIKRA